MNIVYSSDDNYAPHLGVSLLSLLENNPACELNVFVISNGISKDSKQAIEDLAQPYRCDIIWIEFEPFKKRLELDMEWPIAISAYGRLFLPEMLPAWCQKVIYLDCDTVICRSLEHLWTFEMGCLTVAGVKDVIAEEFKTRIGLAPTDSYINSGVLLIDIEAWRANDTQTRFMQFIGAHGGKVTHHDQGVINGVFRGEVGILPPEYNAMTPFFTFRYRNLVRFYNLCGYYTEKELVEARKRPAVIHYTPEFVGRAWEKGCSHPEARRYKAFQKKTAWKGRVYTGERLPTKQRLAYWLQKKAPEKINTLLFGR